MRAWHDLARFDTLFQRCFRLEIRNRSELVIRLPISPSACWIRTHHSRIPISTLPPARLFAMFVRCSSFLLAILAAPMAFGQDKSSREGIDFFEKKVRPVLVKNCYECHSAEAKKLQGKLRLDIRSGIRVGGSNGPTIVVGEPSKSLLIKAVRQTDESLKMPPKGKLTAEEIADLETWIKMGAPDPRVGAAVAATPQAEHWSLRPVRDVAIPKVKDQNWSLTSVDHFILAKLEEKGLKSAPLTDKRTLIRRATYDLTGLPPTPEEIEAFLKDDSPSAFEIVVDRLLASPAYGERWGRHWFDVIRYSDTAGDNSDYPIPQMYRFRNWVIDAIARDLPYDEFIRQQLAGDLLAASGEADRHEKLIATGYLANAKRFGSYADVGEGKTTYPWYLTYEDTIDNFGRTFLGLTINCCRCHDHKFDLLTQADYYALYGFFQSTRYPWPGIELDKVQRNFVPLAPADKVAEFEKQRREETADLTQKIKEREADKVIADKALKDAEQITDDEEKKTKIAKYTKESKDLYNLIKKLKDDKAAIERKPLPFETVYAVVEGKADGKRKMGNACVQIKGDPERLGPEVPRRFPTVLGGQVLPESEKGSGRLQLANWLTDAKNPLTARVMVNRIWQYHFGRGIVPTPSDFGKQGQPPTHPELLDYLATRFIESGWSIKAMHRLVMLSRTYQISSDDDEANTRIDVSNEYLWRFNRHRLDAESIRDTLLMVSGAIDRTPGGPHPFPAMTKWDFTQHNPFKAVYETNRRSVYMMTQRIQRHPFLALFDGADTNASTTTRITSTTPLQSLFFMNDPFVHSQAKAFAARLLKEERDDSRRVERAYWLLFGRPPSAEEANLATSYLGKLQAKVSASDPPTKAWESLVRALFMSNEFVYVD